MKNLNDPLIVTLDRHLALAAGDGLQVLSMPYVLPLNFHKRPLLIGYVDGEEDKERKDRRQLVRAAAIVVVVSVGTNRAMLHYKGDNGVSVGAIPRVLGCDDSDLDGQIWPQDGFTWFLDPAYASSITKEISHEELWPIGQVSPAMKSDVADYCSSTVLEILKPDSGGTIN